MKTLNAENKIVKDPETKKTTHVKCVIKKPPERVNAMYCLAKLVVIRRANYE